MDKIAVFLILLLITTLSPCGNAAVLANWTSGSGYVSDALGSPFVTAHDEGVGSELIDLGFFGPTQAFFFSITNNHPTLSVKIEQITLDLSIISDPFGGGAGEVDIGVGQAPNLTIAGMISTPGNTVFELNRPNAEALSLGIFDLAPGETFFISPFAPAPGGSFGTVNSATITGNVIPEPMSITILFFSLGLLALRRNR